MKSGRFKTRLAALLMGVAMSPAYGVDRTAMPESGIAFKDYDTNKDGFLSLDEFNAKGKDDLAFKAADINGDERLDPGEFDQYLTRKSRDQAKPEPGAAGQPKPAKPASGY